MPSCFLATFATRVLPKSSGGLQGSSPKVYFYFFFKIRARFNNNCDWRQGCIAFSPCNSGVVERNLPLCQKTETWFCKNVFLMGVAWCWPAGLMFLLFARDTNDPWARCPPNTVHGLLGDHIWWGSTNDRSRSHKFCSRVRCTGVQVPPA